MLKIAIIVLAAGASRRFGTSNKLLVRIEGEPLAVRTVRLTGAVQVAGAELETYVVVRGTGVTDALAGAGLTPRTIDSPRAADGMGHSIAAGVASLGPDVDGALVIPADMPLLSVEFVACLLTAFVAAGAQRPAHPLLPDGTRSGPVVWPRPMFQALMALEGDRGGKGLLDGIATVAVASPGEGVLADMDTQADYQRLVESGR